MAPERIELQYAVAISNHNTVSYLAREVLKLKLMSLLFFSS